MKLGALPIILIGFAVAVIALSFGYFHNWDPKMREIQAKETQLASLQEQNRKAPDVQRKIDTTKAMIAEKGQAWRAILAVHTPPKSVEQRGINLAVNAYQLTVDSKKFRENIQRAVNAQSKKGKVRVVTGLNVPEPDDNAAEIMRTYYNFPSRPFPVVVFDLGQITVEGTYQQIMENVRSWASMPNYLAVADGLTITGTSPRLTGTYSVSLVGYIRATAIGQPAIDTLTSTGPTPGG
jgi:hypothetical protein